MKINFTTAHQARLDELALKYLYSKDTFQGTIGTEYNVFDILHCLTVTSLLGMKQVMDKRISTLENQDSWSFTDFEQKKLEELKTKSEFINLVIGWNKYNAELEEIKSKKIELNSKITALKESTKTPEDKIKELEAELAAL